MEQKDMREEEYAAPVSQPTKKSRPAHKVERMRKSLVFVSLLLAVALIYIFVSKLHQSPVLEEPIPAEPTTAVETTPPAQEVEKKTISEKGDGYTIDVHYPKTESSAVTKYMSDFATNAITEFKNDTAWLSDPSVPKSEASTSLTIDYTAQTTDKSIAYIFSMASYTGGAHGITATATFNFNKKTGERYTLDNLFTNEAAGLTALSQYVVAELKKRDISDDQWINDGAGPNEDNYQSLALTEDGIQVFLDPYQVAAYAAGPQTVTVPYSALKSVLVPELQ